MISSRFAAAGLIVLAGCSNTVLPPPLDQSGSDSQPFPAQVRVEKPGMTCRESTRAAKQALKRMGYVIESVATAEAGKTGEIRGRRYTGWVTGEVTDAHRVAVRIDCDDRGSEIAAATEEGFSKRLDFQRDFPRELDRAASRAAARTTRRPQASAAAQDAKLQVFVQPLQGPAAAEILGSAPENVGITPVRIQVRNRSELRYRLEADRFKLISEQGNRERPMPIDEVAAALAPEWRANARQRHIPNADIAPGATLDGYIFVPVAAYRRAKVVLIESTSGEAEGFSVEF